MHGTTYDARVYKTEVYKGLKVTTYNVRWKTGNKLWREPFRKEAQADGFRSALMTAARKGEEFSLATGRPTSWARAKNEMTWDAFACAYVDMKWKDSSASYRRDIVRALVAATPAMIAGTRGRPEPEAIRKALTCWGFNTKQRAECPNDSAKVLRWLEKNTKPMTSLMEADALRHLLDTATTKLDGKRNAASTVARNRAVLYNALEYAVERKALTTNPLKDLVWRAPKSSHEVDRRCVVNPKQARALLKAVGKQKPSGQRLVAFFAVLYFAGLRPEEAVNLRKNNITLPPLIWDPETETTREPDEADNWGELHFENAAPDIGGMWTDDGAQREERGLKHRAEGASRTVPCPPELTTILRQHIADHGYGPGNRLFWGVRGDILPTSTTHRAWDKARKEVLSSEDYASPLAKRIYDLRHACVSTWLNGGVAPTQVAEWAGHSVAVLLRIYAKCLVGQWDTAKLRILEALRA